MDFLRSSQAQARRITHGELTANPRPEDAPPTSVLFREIHKNAWLKKLPSSEKKTGAFPKKGDRVWVVFCVHDDSEAFLELYSDQKLAVTHKPEWFVSLNNCLHVSPTICAQEDEYEFVVTLSSDLIRLTAPTWELMMEWVETIRTKLQEMRILSPRENLYSKMPEARLPLAPTRDPNSPLPPPPAGPSGLVPGVEPVHSETSDSSSSSGSSIEMTNNVDALSLSDDSIRPVQNSAYDNVSVPVRPATTSLYITQSEPPIYRRPRQVLSRAASVPDSPGYSSSLTAPSGPANNVTVIEVSAEHTAPHSALPLGYQGVFNFNFMEDALPRDGEEASHMPPTRNAITVDATPRQAENGMSNMRTTGSSSLTDLSSTHYECVFLPTQMSGSPIRNQPGVVSADGQHRSLQTDMEIPASDLWERRRRRSSSTSETTVTTRPVVSGGRTRSGTEAERRLQPAPHPYRQVGANGGSGGDAVGTGRLTLREQQVLQLRREMMHPGGVRLQLRRRDCTNSIGLVDAFGGVWVAGWKQRERPMLYNVLHIGDQLLSAAGVLVQSASDAQKLIRGASSLYVEFVIRRVPCGRVYAVRRDTEGQDLGIVQEGNTAEIRDVVAGSPAARHGLSPRAQTCDGLSLTNWVLTEINGRPLNLFFKDSEVRGRLNAVGKEISILVQPFDLVKQLKKQLKALRGYKDYIVQ